MKRSFLAVLTMFAMTLSMAGVSLAANNDSKKSAERQTNQLAARLPASDGVVVMDMQRLVRDALPQFLTGRVQFLSEINNVIDQVKGQVGIDLRDFEQVAVGIMFKKTASQKQNYEPLVLARGKADTGALLAAATQAAKGKYREEKVGGKTIYVFAAKEIARANKPNTSTPKAEEDFNRMLGRIPTEIAVTAFDANTLAIGPAARVRETVEAKPRVSQNLLSLVNRKANSMMSFGANLPPNAAQFFGLDADEIGRNLDTIQQASGTVDVVGANTLVSVVAKTYQADQAKNLFDTLEFLRTVGASFLGSAQGADKKVYAKIVESAKLSRNADQLMLDVQVANSDLGVLLGKN